SVSLLLSVLTFCIHYIIFHFFFFLLILRPPISTLFPYTTLFRSVWKHSFGPMRLLVQISRSRLNMRVKPIIILPTIGILSAHKRSEEHTSELQSRFDLVCRLLLEKKKKITCNRI